MQDKQRGEVCGEGIGLVGEGETEMKMAERGKRNGMK